MVRSKTENKWCETCECEQPHIIVFNLVPQLSAPMNGDKQMDPVQLWLCPLCFTKTPVPLSEEI